MRLTKTDINVMVVECVKHILKEKYGDGIAYGSVVPSMTGPSATGKETWRGVKGSRFIWHGEWADPEIRYDGVVINGTEAEEMLWDNYKDYCEEQGIEPENNEAFDEWATEDEAECVLMDLADAENNAF